MKRFLLASAAVIALAVAAPIATAQYTTPPPAAATPAPVMDDPSTPQDESAQAATQPQVTTPGTPETAEPVAPTAAQTQSLDTATQAQTDSMAPDAGVDTTTQAQTTDPAPDAMQAQTDPNTMHQAPSTTYAETTSMDVASLEEHARDAGMDGMPMTAQEVCMPREISLTTSGTRLSRDKQHQLINAADRASVCDIQRVVINSPNGRADSARQMLIDHGVDGNLIEVVDSDTGGLEVEMQFSGIATSSDQYAQMFTTQQFASANTSAMAPGYSPAPSAPSAAPAPAPDPSMSPDPSAPSTDPSMTTPEPNADPMDDTEEEDMSPTSGEPYVTRDMTDI